MIDFLLHIHIKTSCMYSFFMCVALPPSPRVPSWAIATTLPVPTQPCNVDM